MRIAIVAFEALPAVGTEAGLAWHWGTAYRQLGHEVTVLTQGAGTTPAAMSMWRDQGIEVKTVGDLPVTVAPTGPREMMRNFLRYGRWTKLVTRELQQDARYDLVHQVSLSSIRLRWVEPRSGVPFVLGPVGGAHVPPVRLVLGRNLFAEALRAASIPLLGIARWIDVKFRRKPELVYVTNDGTHRFARGIGLDGVERMLTDGIPADLLVTSPRLLRGEGRSLLWAGRMVGSKRPDLALSVVAELDRRGVDVRLIMAGDGPELDNLKRQAALTGLTERVDFLGRVPWTEVIERYETVDAFLFTSVRDSSCPGVLEAAARGRPSIALRHQGVGALVPPDVALGPTLGGGSGLVIEGLVDACAGLFASDARYAGASVRALKYAASESWSLKAQRVLSRSMEGVR